MATDALDPGEDGSYPFMPRNSDGTLDIERMPVGHRKQKGPDGKVILLDVAPGQVHDLFLAGVLTLPAGVELAS